MSPRSLAFALFGISALLAAPGCSGSDAAEEDAEAEDDSHESSALTHDEKDAVCNAIEPGRAWTQEESQRLMNEVIKRAIDTKRTNDALIKQRGVGRYSGVRSNVMKAIAAGDKSGAAAAIRPYLRGGQDATSVVDELKGTSCIGWVYTLLRESYAALGRQSEWAAIEKCGRAWDSDGLHVQQALIRAGWPSPALPIANDVATAPGNEGERELHRSFLGAVAAGKYFGTPISTDTMLKNFLPSPGSRTTKDTSMLVRIGGMNTFAIGTLRAAYHVPIVVPARAVPADLAPAGTTRAKWIAARDRGEPFVVESHSLRMPWDPTNFEIRPLTEVVGETFSQSVVYSTGTLLFAPKLESPLVERAPESQQQ